MYTPKRHLYLYMFLNLSPRFSGSLRENQSTLSRSTVQCSPSDRHTRSRFHFIEIAMWLLCPRATDRSDLCIHLYGLGSVRLLSRFNGTKRSVALFISVMFRVTSRFDFRLILLPLNIYTRALVMFYLWTNRTSQKAIAIAHCYRCSLYLSYQKKNYSK